MFYFSFSIFLEVEIHYNNNEMSLSCSSGAQHCPVLVLPTPCRLGDPSALRLFVISVMSFTWKEFSLLWPGSVMTKTKVVGWLIITDVPSNLSFLVFISKQIRVHPILNYSTCR